MSRWCTVPSTDAHLLITNSNNRLVQLYQPQLIQHSGDKKQDHANGDAKSARMPRRRRSSGVVHI